MKKLSVVYQHDLMDCGAAVLLIVAKYFGLQTDYRWIRKRLEIGPDGATISDLYTMAEAVGLGASPIEFERLQDLNDEEGLFLFCTKPESVANGAGHFVVVLFLKNGFCEISDPSNGVIKVKVETLEGRFYPQALHFSANNFDLKKRNLVFKSNEVTEVKRVFFRYKSSLVVLGTLSLCISALNVLPSYLFGKIVDELTTASGNGFNWLFVFAYVSAMGFRDFFGVYQNYCFSRFGQIFSMNLTGLLVRRVMGLNWKEFSTRRYGDYTNRFGAVAEFQGLASEIVGSTLGRITTLVLAGVTLALIDFRLLLVAALMGIFALVINLYAATMKSKFGYQLNIQSSGTGSSVYELLSLKKWIMLNDASSYFFRRWSRLNKKLIRMNSYLLKNSLKWNTINILNSTVLELGGFALVVFLFKQGELSAGKLVTVISLQAVVMSTLSSFDSLKLSSRNAKLSYDRLLDLFTDIPPTSTKDLKRKIQENAELRKVSLRDVSFSYRGEESSYVLKNVNIDLFKDQITVIRGTSGSGKSTILGIFAGVFNPQKGSAVIDDQYVIEFDELRKLKLCTFVDQEYRFFEGTIFENLTLGHKKDLVLLNKLLEDAGLMEQIGKFSKGIFSEISDVSRGFSGGQLQRLSVVRALLTEKPIIILDEPTSALDLESEKKICELLIKNKAGRIILISAHSSVVEKIADKVIKIEGLTSYEQK
jgi:ABC-type bacteriocin/lantibiotic exporter with double-glycine peptidase domain